MKTLVVSLISALFLVACNVANQNMMELKVTIKNK